MVEVHKPDFVSSFSMLPSMAQSIEDVAVAHFMSSYVPGSHFDYLPCMYGQSGADTVLSATVHAASMALLALELGQTSLMAMARRSYGKALLETNSALADPKVNTHDTTLISVLLLSLFEAIVWASPGTPRSWTTHTQGALALLKLRGSHQVGTLVGRKLLFQVANVICVSSMQQRTRLPPDLVDLIHSAIQDEREYPSYRLACLTGDVSNLIADIDEGIIAAEAAVRAAQSLDAQYVSFSKSFLLAWKYREIVLDEPQPEVYGKTVHQYPSQRAAQIWNSYRMTRILLNEIVHACAKGVPSSSGAQIQNHAASNVQEMASEISASIPQFTHPEKFSVPLEPGFSRFQVLSIVPAPESISPKAAAASLLWPLSAIRGASLASEDVRAYAVERLKFLGREFRVPQAEKVALLTSKEFDALQDGLHMLYVS